MFLLVVSAVEEGERTMPIDTNQHAGPYVSVRSTTKNRLLGFGAFLPVLLVVSRTAHKGNSTMFPRGEKHLFSVYAVTNFQLGERCSRVSIRKQGTKSTSKEFLILRNVIG